MRNRRNESENLERARQDLAACEAAGRVYERAVKSIMAEYERAVAPALKRYQAAEALIKHEMREEYNQASPQKRQEMLLVYEQKREKLWLVFTRETGSQASKRDRELTAASIRYNTR